MKKIIIFILVIIFILAAAPFPLVSAPIELEPELLDGISYVRVRCQFNGVPYYIGVKGLNTQKMEEFNAEEVEAALKEAGIPISKKKFRAMYDRLESQLKKAGFRILEIRKTDSTVIPTISLNLEAMSVSNGHELYVLFVHVTVSKWISTWVGTRNIQSPVIVWWKYKMVTAGPEELNKTIDAAVKELMNTFLHQWREANREEEEGGEKEKRRSEEEKNKIKKEVR